MVKIIECPACNNKGLKIEVNNGYRVITTGRPMKEYPLSITCTVCKRKIKYAVEKAEQ